MGTDTETTAYGKKRLEQGKEMEGEKVLISLWDEGRGR